MDIKEIALKVALDTVNKLYDSTASYSELTEEDKKFYGAFAQALVAEIQRQSEPECFQERQQTKDGYTDWYDAYVGRDIASTGSKICGGIEYQWRPLFTFPPSTESEQSVKVPTTEDEAALMVLLGTNWLESNAPHRLNNNIEALEDKVAEACAEMTDDVCAKLQTDDKSIDYWHGVGAAATAIENAIRSGEWKKFMKGE